MAEPDEHLSFATPADWGAWLATYHDSVTEVWITYWKKGSGQPSIDWQQAVVEALCWGWIDGIRETVDARRFKQRFTPRKKGSIWSKINCNHVERLTAEGRMQPAGLRAVAEARANGQWDKAYGGGMAAMDVPEELRAALADNPAAQQAWDQLDTKNRYAICYRVLSPKKAETRAKKAGELLAMIQRGEKIYP